MTAASLAAVVAGVDEDVGTVHDVVEVARMIVEQRSVVHAHAVLVAAVVHVHGAAVVYMLHADAVVVMGTAVAAHDTGWSQRRMVGMAVAVALLAGALSVVRVAAVEVHAAADMPEAG